MTTILSHSEYTARKQHECSMCGLTIDPGTRYIRQVNVDDTDMYTMRYHDECYAYACATWDQGDWEAIWPEEEHRALALKWIEANDEVE